MDTFPLASGSSNPSGEIHSVSREGILGIRKRVDSSGDGSFLSISRGKRPRISAMGRPSSYGQVDSIGFGADRLTRPRSLFDPDTSSVSMSSIDARIFSPSRPLTRTRSGASSFSLASCPPSPLSGGAEICQQGIAMMRSASSSSLASNVQQYPESSAKHFLNHTRTTVDYSPPDATDGIRPRLLSCSTSNVMYFTRGNRIHCKEISTNFNTDISQLCKLADKVGNILAMESGGTSQPDQLAIATSMGYVQIWDVKTKKVTLELPNTKDVTALAWNGTTLSVGGGKGSIRHYDTRLPTSKLKEQARVIRHHGRVTCLQWNVDGRFLASGDTSGTVHCWELGQRVPLEVGEFTSRRKKIHHEGKISAVSWSPWQPKMLATGDDKGVFRLWNINDKDCNSNALKPGKIDIGAAITGIHISPQCKEILTTHGAQVGERVTEQYQAPKPRPENAIMVYSYPTLRFVTTYRLPAEHVGPIGDSILDNTGTKLIFATPAHNKIDVCTIWSKRRELKKQQSFSEYTTRIR